MTTPRVLGLDLSMTATGICLPDGTTRTVKTNTKDGDRRLQNIVSSIGIALDDMPDGTGYDVDLAVIEDLPVAQRDRLTKAIWPVPKGGTP